MPDFVAASMPPRARNAMLPTVSASGMTSSAPVSMRTRLTAGARLSTQ